LPHRNDDMTRHDLEGHRRRSIRLPGYDYAQPGVYFVTICTHDRECVLGEVVGGSASFSPFGEVADECWRDLPSHFPGLLLDRFAVMPNHVHGIIVLGGATHASPLRGDPRASPLRGDPRASTPRVDPCADALRVDPHASPLPVGTTAHGPRSGSVAAIVGSLKSATTRRVNRVRGTPGAPFWQRGYYEHVIRDEGDLEKIRTYVAQNPISWELDENCLDHLPGR
jgi:putative transposase